MLSRPRSLRNRNRMCARGLPEREDIETHLYRLLLEYGRVVDVNSGQIGPVGDGDKEMEGFDRLHPAV